MAFGKIMTIAALLALSPALAGCGEWQGSKYIDPTPASDQREGPGLFTGKEGGIVLYNDVWTGATPYGGVE